MSEPLAPSASEREFYLREFRGRTLGVAGRELAYAEPLAAVVDELTGSGTRVVVLCDARAPLEKVLGGRWLSADATCLEAEAWRALRVEPRLGIELARGAPFLPAVRDVVLRLGIFKLALLDPDGGMSRPDRGAISFVHLDELKGLLAAAGPGDLSARRRRLLREVQAMLEAGVPSVNVCRPENLGDELFTYAGSGTLFTRERYVTVRRLGIDDFDAAADLLTWGTSEGFLAPRAPAEVDRVLASGFGAFVEGRYLAGIGALLRRAGEDLGEIASLYAITRFLGEGIGTHLVAFALEWGRELGLRRIFACTTSERAVSFFERQRFARVAPEALPPRKWETYDPERRARVVCLACEL
jgi:amino-acid N-acetyltransferase